MYNAINKKNLVERLYSSIPGFKEYSLLKQLDTDLPYIVAGDFSRYLVELYKENETAEFYKVGEFIESLYEYGDDFIKEIATIGFLESIQNYWDNNNIDPQNFYNYLQPTSKKEWDKLNKFWN